MAATPSGLDAGTLVKGSIDNIEGELTEIGPAALLVGAMVVALGVGWRFGKKFVKG